MTVFFDLDELWKLKRAHPDWVILLGDKAKNPSRLVGPWRDLTCQSMEDLEALVAKVQSSEVEAWNFGPRTGLGGLACFDWDWEFLAYGWMRRFGERAATLTFRTPNLGFRMLFITVERENSSPFKRFLHMEFENGGYVAVGGFAEDAEGEKKAYVKFLDKPIRADNAIVADTKSYLLELVERYDFLRFNCVAPVVDRKHIRLDHNQRLALVQFMVSKGFSDDEIHDFFRTVYRSDGKRDYDHSITCCQIESARRFHDGGGRPNPCSAKTNPENGHVSTPLFQVFGSDIEKCGGCVRRQRVHDEVKETRERELEEVLDGLRSRFVFKTPTDLQDLFYYDGGIYRPAECMVEGLLEAELGAKASSHFVSEVLEHLKRGSYVERSVFNRFVGLVPVLNGLLNLETLELKPFDPEVVFTYKLNVKYDPSARCPVWLGFLCKVLPVEDHALVQEWLGYCVLPAMPKHKIMWFIGSGRNGKGRVVMTAEFIVGRENCSYLELGEFDGEHRFAVAGMYGKLVNVSSEPSTVGVLQTALLKKITGEDSLDAEVKGKQKRLSFCNIAKPFVLGNSFPKVNDLSLAFEDRLLIVKFPYSFVGKDQIDNIERTWLGDPVEVSGIFNWMLEGLRRLAVNGDFTLSKTTREMFLEFKRASDPFGAWLADRCEFDVDGFVSRKAAFEDYKCYVDEELGKTPETERRFYQRLRDTPKVRDFDGREGRGFNGIRLKDCQDKTQSSQSTLGSTTVSTDSTGILNCKNQGTESVSSENKLEKPAVSVATAAASLDSGELTVLVEPSRGEPCEGATSGGDDCPFASESYLVDPGGQRSAWCKSHLKLVMSRYDPRSYSFKYGNNLGFGDG